MADARARGKKAVYLIGLESTIGTAPNGSGGGVYAKPIMNSLDFGPSRQLDDDPTWNGTGEEATDPVFGPIDVSGNMAFPVCSRAVGFMLKLLFGAPATVDNGGGSFTHTFKSTGDPLSFSAQRGHPALTVPNWRTALGVRAGGLQFSMSRTGRTLFTMPLLGLSDAKDVGGTRDADPVTYAFLPFDNAGGSIKIASSQVANVTGGQFDFTNNLEGVETIRADNALDGIDPGERGASGSLDARLGASTTISDLADGGTPGALEYAFTLTSDSNVTLKFQMPRTFFSSARAPISGPGGISQNFSWRAAHDESSGYMLAAVLTNDVESYA